MGNSRRWPFVTYVDPSIIKYAAEANGIFIRIAKGYEEDEGLYQHELMHVKQWLITLTLHYFIYYFSSRYRLWAEVQAYRKQMQYTKKDESLRFAEFIATKYGLDYPEPYIHSLLIKK